MNVIRALRDAARDVLREVNDIFISKDFVRRRKTGLRKARVAKAKARTIRAKPSRKVAPVRVTKSERKTLRIIEAPQPPEEFEDKDTDDWNRVLSGADERLKEINKVVAEPVKEKRERLFPTETLTKGRRQLLFMNVGTDKVLQAKYALQVGSPLPLWAENFTSGELTIEKGKLMFEGLPMVTKEDKRSLVKELYFDPKKPSTIQPITDALRAKYANISRSNVRNILRSIETYQRNFRRARPVKNKVHVLYKNPGVIAVDAFFPSARYDGWDMTGTAMVLCCMDVWSRFSSAYPCSSKKGEVQGAQELPGGDGVDGRTHGDRLACYS